MAAKAPANEYLEKLIQLIKRYDLDELLDAATTFRDWTVISNDEKRDIKSQSCKQRRLDRLMTLITENGREAAFANFIVRYNLTIQNAALAVVSTAKPNVTSTTMGLKAASSQLQILQPDDGSQKLSASPMEIDTTACPEATSMDIGSKVWNMYIDGCNDCNHR